MVEHGGKVVEPVVKNGVGVVGFGFGVVIFGWVVEKVRC